ncbi:MAG: Cytochrome c5 [uncultured bacterium]|nr:MAG: Cytochrome c5 [uncultured bacterium]
MIILLFILSGALGFVFSLYRYESHHEEVVQQIETFHYPVLFVKQLTGDPHAGKKIFKQFCASCHGNPALIDINAPHIGDREAWKLRRKMGMKSLMEMTINGAGAMPARGGCFECSDAQLREAVHYMLNQSMLVHGE